MLAKITAKNQLTFPNSITSEFGPVEYFDIETGNGQVVLTQMRIQRADAVRAKLAELKLSDQNVADAVAWARKTPRKPGNEKKN